MVKVFFCSPQGHGVSGDQRLIDHAILDPDRLRLPPQGASQAEPDANVGQQGETHLGPEGETAVHRVVLSQEAVG